MKLSMEKRQLINYTKRQLDFYLPDGYEIPEKLLEDSVEIALGRCEKCFRHILLPGYCKKGEAFFYHLHQDQHATFLYFLGNTVWKEYGEKQFCDKLMNLTRILHGFLLSYKCQMPDVFILGHPAGSIIGNAIYSDGLYISQNVTINTHTDSNGNIDLKIGKGCLLGAGAKVIGNQTIGDRVSIGVDALIYNQAVENDSVCLRDKSGKVIIRKRKREKCKASEYFDLDFD